jgi:hypothetical protein
LQRGVLTLFGWLLFSGMACSSSSAPPHAAPDGGDAAGAAGYTGEVSCTSDPRVDTYTANLTRAGERGTLIFRLNSSDPVPPAKGPNTFVVSVLDGDGQAVSADLRIALLMPDHGHGTQVPATVTYDESSGTYSIAPVYLFMAGVWRVELGLYSDTDQTKPVDTAVFFFCIEG